MNDGSSEGVPFRLPLLSGTCGICLLCAIGLAQLEGAGNLAALVRLAILAKSEGHSRFHRRMNRRMTEKKMGINLELLSQIAFVEKTDKGVEISKIVPPAPEAEASTCQFEERVE